MTYLSAVLKVEYSIQYTGVVKSTNTAKKKKQRAFKDPSFQGRLSLGIPFEIRSMDLLQVVVLEPTASFFRHDSLLYLVVSTHTYHFNELGSNQKG
jgi:hypothetical protein